MVPGEGFVQAAVLRWRRIARSQSCHFLTEAWDVQQLYCGTLSSPLNPDPIIDTVVPRFNITYAKRANVYVQLYFSINYQIRTISIWSLYLHARLPGADSCLYIDSYIFQPVSFVSSPAVCAFGVLRRFENKLRFVRMKGLHHNCWNWWLKYRLVNRLLSYELDLLHRKFCHLWKAATHSDICCWHVIEFTVMRKPCFHYLVVYSHP